MGRKLRRVPLDFAWPLNMIWKGYVNPYGSQECPCHGGYNVPTQTLSDNFFGRHGWEYKLTQDEVDALIAAGRLHSFTGRHVPREGWQPIDPPPVVTAAQVNEAAANSPMIHDSINQHILVKARATRLGVFGFCSLCRGEGRIWQSRQIKRLHDAWKPRNPPRGPGYQLWETTSEGSPVSPVFETLDALCAWCEVHATTSGEARATRDAWKQMLLRDNVHHRSTLPNGVTLISL